jgi:hypothetical protein
MFTVRTEDVYRISGGYNYMNGSRNFEPVPGFKGIINNNTNDLLSVMSKSYEPVSGAQVLDKFMELFQEAQVEVRPIKHHITRGKDGVMGRSEFMEVELPAYTLMPNTPEEQKLRIVIPNSYDGTKQLKMMIMLYRLVCSNGMMGWKQDFSFSFKHRRGAIDRLGDALNLYLLNQLENVGNIVNILANQRGTADNIMLYFDNNKILQGERWQEKLMGKWLIENQPTDLWGLYNVFTNLITHEYGRNFSSKLNKLDLLNLEVKTKWPRIMGIQHADSFEEALLAA